MILENKFLVGVQGEEVVIMGFNFHKRLSKDEAMNLAAWLAALADPQACSVEGEFHQLLLKVLHL